MEILTDREIPGAATAFAPFGTVRLFDGRTLCAAEIAQADVLIVRSVTRVDATLLDGSGVRFVGTATAGTDHIDTAYLATAGIAFSDAAGCNARAVAEHVICCVYLYAARRGIRVQDLRVAVVGYGHVGRALGAVLDLLGIPFVVNDPPLGTLPPGVSAVTLDDALCCDVVSLHVPLTADGPHRTVGLVDAAALARMAPGALLINPARGGVVDERALVAHLQSGKACLAAIDCWLDEPHIAIEVLRQCWLATPHIAGHTLEARVRATTLLRVALAQWSGKQPTLADLPVSDSHTPLDCGPGLPSVLARVHDVEAHTARMRSLLSLPPAARGAAFDTLRREHGLRRQFASFAVASAGLDADTVRQLQALGFSCRGG